MARRGSPWSIASVGERKTTTSTITTHDLVGCDSQRPDQEVFASRLTRYALDRIPFCIPKRYALRVATEQIAVRLPGSLLSDLDELVKGGAYESRAAAVRAGIEAIMKLELQRQTDRAVVEGYTRQPQTETDEHEALSSLRAAILDEPW